MIKPINEVVTIPKNEAYFCPQDELFCNTDRCPICDSQTVVMSQVMDRTAQVIFDCVNLCDSVESDLTPIAEIVEKVMEKHKIRLGKTQKTLDLIDEPR